MVNINLENITDKSTWLADETFTNADGQTKVRKAGDPVSPKLMQSWRAVRRQNPDLLKNMLVWQQPAATYDTVIWRWTQDLCQAEHPDKAVLLAATPSPAAGRISHAKQRG